MKVTELHDSFSKAVDHTTRKEYDPALRLLDRILLEDPSFVIGWNTRGSVLAAVNAHFDAILNYNMAISISPKDANLYNNRGSVFISLGYFDRALIDYKHAIELNPKLPEAHDGMGVVLRRTGQIEESLDCFRKAIEAKPDHANAHLGLAMSLLELQRFEEGWKEFEWRWESGQMPPRSLPYPTWRGERCTDKTLLVIAEQGHGDALQFCRYAKFAKEMFGGKVCFEIRPALSRLFRGVEGIDQVIMPGEVRPPGIGYWINLLSLPSVVGTEKGFVGPYFKVGQGLRDYWFKMLKDLAPGVRVGLCWAGLSRPEQPVAHSVDQRRSITLAQFAPLARVKGVTWVSLQTGLPGTEVKTPPVGMAIADATRDLDDFYETAALIENLDLVISVDTAVVHLAAGLGKPTWMLSRFDGCWRWFGDQPRSPWYPSLRQYRQPTEGDWGSVMDMVARDLQRFVVAKRKQAA